MRIAICFKGMFDSGSKGGMTGHMYAGSPSIDIDYSLIAHQFYKKNVLDKNLNIDIFCHNWGTEYTEHIKSLYNPIKILSENNSEVQELKDKKSGMRVNNRNHAIISNWYSIMKSVDLMREYEIEKSIKYDVVLIARYDVAILKPLIFSNKDYDFENIMYHSGPDPIHGEGCTCPNCNPKSASYEIPDLIFFSNSDNIYNFSRVFLKYNCKTFCGYGSNHIIGTKIVRALNLNRGCVTYTNTLKIQRWKSLEVGGNITIVRWMEKDARNKIINEMLGLDIKQILNK